MANPFIGEIRLFGGNYPPVGWAFCNGQLLQISQYDALFNLIGTTYGGDGQSTFGVPNLLGRLPVHVGSGFAYGQSAGTETVTLTSGQIPAHQHALNATTAAATTPNAAGAIPANGNPIYSANTPNVAMSSQGVAPAGGNQAHDNVMPFLAVSFIICLEGIYPTQG